MNWTFETFWEDIATSWNDETWPYTVAFWAVVALIVYGLFRWTERNDDVPDDEDDDELDNPDDREGDEDER